MVDITVEDDINEEVIGDIGETLFAHLVAFVPGMTANPPHKDRKGHDYIVEYPLGGDSMWRLEEATCKVQVKATQRGRSVRLKLSNVARMASDPIPWFVFAGFLDDARKPTETALIHIDERFLKCALARLNDLPPDGKIHQRVMCISWGQDDLVEQTGAALEARIKHHVGASMWDYVARKRSWRDGLVLARGVTGTLAIAGANPAEVFEILSDLELGVVDRVPFAALRVTGLAMPPGVHEGSGYLEVADRRPVGRAVIQVEADGELAEIRCDTYVSGVRFPLPPEHVRMRLVSSFLSIMVREGQATVSWQFGPPPTQTVPLAEFGATGRLVRLLSKPARRDLSITIGDETQTVTISDADICAWPDEVQQAAMTAENSVAVAAAFGLDTRTDIDPTLLLAQRQRLILLRALLERRADVPSITVDDTNAQGLDGQVGAVVVCPGVIIGETVLVACIGLEGTIAQETHSASITIHPSKIHVLNLCTKRRSAWAASEGHALVEQGIQKLTALGIPNLITVEPTHRGLA